MARVTSGLPGAGFEGKFGNAVLYRSGEETLMRERVIPHNLRTAAQTASRLGFGRASQGWARLTDAEFAAWEASGGYRTYMSLTRKWLSVHPQGVAPTMPPVGAFLGDAVRVRIVEPGAESGAAPSPLDAPNSALLTLVSDRPNGAGVVTEILIQPLAGVRRKPKARGWRTAGFYAFTDSVRSVSIPVVAGAWAVAYRFVDAGSGQETAMASLGAVAVP